MSWQKYSIKLVLGFPLSLPIVAYAINVGDTYVQTQQNQPLNASINVSDIDPRTFSVKIAQGDVYRQLGLSKDSDIQVKFVPTSSNGGQILLTSKQPINAPFADVVLNITEAGVTKTLPKTLLMPLDSSQRITTQANTSTFQSPQQNIVIGSQAPLRLPAMTPDIQQQSSNNQAMIATAMPNLPTAGTSNSITPTTLANESSSYLNIQETRTIRPIDSAGTDSTAQGLPQSNIPQPINVDNALPQPFTTTKSNSRTRAVTPNIQSQVLGETITYTLQRNDNLWTIASNIAAANRKDVDKVMADIMAANPTAFPDNDPTKLVANTQIQIPKYKVVPSQIGIKAANKARQQYRQTKKRTQVKKSATPTKKSSPTIKPAKAAKVNKQQKYTAPKKVNTTVTPKATKKSEMTIIAPNTTNGSVQGQNDAKNKLGKGISSQVVAQVQQKRQATAQQATKVNKLNQDLVGAENRLKIQNAKLAQLEKRLKELNKK